MFDVQKVEKEETYFGSSSSPSLLHSLCFSSSLFVCFDEIQVFLD